jgi:site-specific DNA-methyltransferase (adenine-specific)
MMDMGGSMAPKPITENTLFYGDNLFILREHIPSESVDLIYLDPPFNSNRSYNVLFKDEHGTESEAQIEAFEDTWRWNLEAEQTYAELLTEAPDHLAKMIESLHEFIGPNQMMAYLVMMATRLVELHRVWTDDNLTAKGLSGGGYEYEYKGVRSLWRCPEETMRKLYV